MGARQIAALTRYLEVVYAMKGIKMKDPSTWRKKNPTLADLRSFLERSLEKLEIVSSFKAAQKLDAVNAKARRISSSSDDVANGVDGAHEKLEELKVIAGEAYLDFLKSVKTGEELKEILNAKKNVGSMIESILDRIQTLEGAGVFSSGGQRFDSSKKIFRFDLRTLSLDEKIIFIDTMCKKIYDHSTSTGTKSRCKELIVIDEASDFMDGDKDSIYNKIAIGARKFGLGMLMASQSIHHFSDDILMNSAMKVVLGVDNLYTKQVSDRIRVKEEQLKLLKPKMSALAMVRSKDADAPEGWQSLLF